MTVVDEDQQQPPAPEVDEPIVDDDEPRVDDEPRELDDDEPEQLPDDPEPTEQPVTEADVERANKQLDRVETYLQKKMEEIYSGDAAELVDCELCTWSRTFGKRWPVLPPELVRDAVKLAVGLGTVEALNPYPAFQTCETCAGEGNVRTGSKVTQYLFRTCPTCGGQGYTSSLDADQQRTTLTLAAPVAAVAPVEGAPPSLPDFDMFGTPAGHPDYGKLAQYRDVPVSEWQHNLAPGA